MILKSFRDLLFDYSPKPDCPVPAKGNVPADIRPVNVSPEFRIPHQTRNTIGSITSFGGKKSLVRREKCGFEYGRNAESKLVLEAISKIPLRPVELEKPGVLECWSNGNKPYPGIVRTTPIDHCRITARAGMNPDPYF